MYNKSFGGAEDGQIVGQAGGDPGNATRAADPFPAAGELRAGDNDPAERSADPRRICRQQHTSDVIDSDDFDAQLVDHVFSVLVAFQRARDRQVTAGCVRNLNLFSTKGFCFRVQNTDLIFSSSNSDDICFEMR